MIMEGILKNWRGFVNEGITSQGKITFDYYAFDWDDNLMKMPTQIMLLDTEGNEVGMSTEDFAAYRGKLKNGEKFSYVSHTDSKEHLISGFATNPFRNFREEGDQKFIQDAKIAEVVVGPWRQFVRAINMGSYFAIITARGHNPNTLKRAVKELIDEGREGLNKQRLINSLKNYKKYLGQQVPTINDGEKTVVDGDKLVEEYLNNCQFSPVSHPQIAGSGDGGAASSPEQLKIQEFQKFKQKMEENTKLVTDQLGETHKSIHSTKFRIGFSDDDPENVEKFHKFFHEDASVYTFATSPQTGKTKRIR